MTLDEFIKKSDLERLTSAWRRLTPWQKTALLIRIVAGPLARAPLRLLDAHLVRRRAVFAYHYPAHWLA